MVKRIKKILGCVLVFIVFLSTKVMGLNVGEIETLYGLPSPQVEPVVSTSSVILKIIGIILIPIVIIIGIIVYVKKKHKKQREEENNTGKEID